jgi:hypothetical protein
VGGESGKVEQSDTIVAQQRNNFPALDGTEPERGVGANIVNGRGEDVIVACLPRLQVNGASVDDVLPMGSDNGNKNAAWIIRCGGCLYQELWRFKGRAETWW